MIEAAFLSAGILLGTAHVGGTVPNVPKTEREHAAADEVERLTAERDMAIDYLARWCVAVDVNGTGWDDWDEHYKDAAYRPSPIRELLDAAIAEAQKEAR
jgi:hypothetical protein